MIKFKTNDQVKVTAGKDKGRTGKIEKIYPKEGLVLLPEINMYKKHVKGMGEVKGGVYNLPRPLPLAKIALICPNCKKETRIGFRMIGAEKVRFCKKCNKEIDKNK